MTSKIMATPAEVDVARNALRKNRILDKEVGAHLGFSRIYVNQMLNNHRNVKRVYLSKIHDLIMERGIWLRKKC